MTTALDSNILVALWAGEPALSGEAADVLEHAGASGELVIAGPVYAELLAAPGRDQRFLEGFLQDAQIRVDWATSEFVWRAAGTAYRSYAERRRRQRDGGPRRILADFVIGAHALVNGYRLLTLDAGIYRAAFPKLDVATV